MYKKFFISFADVRSTLMALRITHKKIKEKAKSYETKRWITSMTKRTWVPK